METVRRARGVLIVCCRLRSRARARFTAKALAAQPSKNWPTNGGNVYNQRYSTLTSLTKDNVKDVKGIWHADLDKSGIGPGFSAEAQPLFYNGVLYTVTGANDAFAIASKRARCSGSTRRTSTSSMA